MLSATPTRSKLSTEMIAGSTFRISSVRPVTTVTTFPVTRSCMSSSHGSPSPLMEGSPCRSPRPKYSSRTSTTTGHPKVWSYVARGAHVTYRRAQHLSRAGHLPSFAMLSIWTPLGRPGMIGPCHSYADRRTSAYCATNGPRTAGMPPWGPRTSTRGAAAWRRIAPRLSTTWDFMRGALTKRMYFWFGGLLALVLGV